MEKKQEKKQEEKQEEKQQQNQKEQQKANWNIKPYLAIGLTAFIVIGLSMSLFFLIYRYHGLAANWSKLMGILQPVIIGLAFAYLINPIVKWEEKYVVQWLEPHMKRKEKVNRVSRGISVLGALLLVFIIFAILLKMVIPELYNSVERLIDQLPKQVNLFLAWMENYVSSDSQFSSYLEQFLNRGVKFFEDWVQTDFLPQVKGMLSSLTTGVISVVRVLFNLILGVIISVYLLMSKETFVGQTKKLIYTLLPAGKGNVLIETVRKSNDIFGGFISGKILDSAIIGVLCFLGLSILKMPYVVLVSVIVGVTNIIPFFGPYIGAVPSAFLIILANPIQGLYFLIFILVLQQLDGNVIGPRILGESTGLSSFWVVFAILVGGGLFGFVGMVLGVPVFATFYYLVRKMVAYILRKKGLPEQTASYTEATKVNLSTGQLDYTKEEPAPEENKKKK